MRYLTNIAKNRVRDIRYANRDIPGAVTTVPRTAFNTPRPGPKPVWSGDFKDNARLQRGPDRSQPQPRPDHNQGTWRDPRSQSGSAINTAPPTALAPVNTDRRTGDGRMTVPRAPTDRRQIQSDGSWNRTDGQGASFARPTTQRPVSEPPREQTDRAIKTLVPPPAIRVAPNSSADRANSPGDRAVSMPQRNESSGSNRSGNSSSSGDQGRSAGFANRADSAAPRGQLSRPQPNFNRP